MSRILRSEMSPRSFFGLVGLCLSLALLHPVPVVAQETTWSPATPWWCFKTGSYCQWLDQWSDVIATMTPCPRIPATAYYDAYDVIINCGE